MKSLAVLTGLTLASVAWAGVPLQTLVVEFLRNSEFDNFRTEIEQKNEAYVRADAEKAEAATRAGLTKMLTESGVQSAFEMDCLQKVAQAFVSNDGPGVKRFHKIRLTRTNDPAALAYYPVFSIDRRLSQLYLDQMSTPEACRNKRASELPIDKDTLSLKCEFNSAPDTPRMSMMPVFRHHHLVEFIPLGTNNWAIHFETTEYHNHQQTRNVEIYCR